MPQKRAHASLEPEDDELDVSVGVDPLSVSTCEPPLKRPRVVRNEKVENFQKECHAHLIKDILVQDTHRALLNYCESLPSSNVIPFCAKTWSLAAKNDILQRLKTQKIQVSKLLEPIVEDFTNHVKERGEQPVDAHFLQEKMRNVDALKKLQDIKTFIKNYGMYLALCSTHYLAEHFPTFFEHSKDYVNTLFLVSQMHNKDLSCFVKHVQSIERIFTRPRSQSLRDPEVEAVMRISQRNGVLTASNSSSNSTSANRHQKNTEGFYDLSLPYAWTHPQHRFHKVLHVLNDVIEKKQITIGHMALSSQQKPPYSLYELCAMLSVPTPHADDATKAFQAFNPTSLYVETLPSDSTHKTPFFQALSSLKSLHICADSENEMPPLSAPKDGAPANAFMESLASHNISQNLTHFKMSGYNIQKRFPFEHLFSLTSLSIVKSGATTLPDALNTLKHLNTLDLRCNALTTLPFYLKEFTSLEHLFLQNNALTDVPPVITSLISLKNLDLSCNPITSLINPQVDVKDWKNLFRLEHLALSDTNINHIPHTIIDLPKLKGLGLKNLPLVSIIGGSDAIDQLATYQKKISKFESLRCENIEPIEELFVRRPLHHTRDVIRLKAELFESEKDWWRFNITHGKIILHGPLTEYLLSIGFTKVSSKKSGCGIVVKNDRITEVTGAKSQRKEEIIALLNNLQAQKYPYPGGPMRAKSARSAAS